MTKLSDLHCCLSAVLQHPLHLHNSLLMFIFYIVFLNIRPWSYNRETPFPENKTMVFNLVPKLSTHEGHFSNIRPGIINGKNRYRLFHNK